MLTAVLIVVAVLILLPVGIFFFIGERGRFLPSTWAFLRLSGFSLQSLHGYLYGRFTKNYFRALYFAPGNPRDVALRFAEGYHGKVLRHDEARNIICLDKPIERRDLDKIIPYPVARDLILQAPPDIVAYECVCRSLKPHHCEPTQVCMVVGKPFTDFALEHNPQSTRRLTRDEALALLEAEHLRGHVHSAWFKNAMANRFYAICNCCKCCCGGIRMMVKAGVPMVASSGYVAQIDAELCANCGDCVGACPFRAMAYDDDKVVRNWDRCMGCGVCEVKCQTGAVSLILDGRKGVPLDVKQLS